MNHSVNQWLKSLLYIKFMFILILLCVTALNLTYLHNLVLFYTLNIYLERKIAAKSSIMIEWHFQIKIQQEDTDLVIHVLCVCACIYFSMSHSPPLSLTLSLGICGRSACVYVTVWTMFEIKLHRKISLIIMLAPYCYLINKHDF